jgi:hypothetical protein
MLKAPFGAGIKGFVAPLNLFIVLGHQVVEHLQGFTKPLILANETVVRLNIDSSAVSKSQRNFHAPFLDLID